MKIYLEAFVDTNFGDNLFVHTVVSRYPQHTFYMLEREGYEASYRILREQEKNIILVPAEHTDDFLSGMDAMMLVGGDIFGEYTDYATLIARARRIKEQRGYVFFLGLSLMKAYTSEHKYHMRLLLTWADVVVARETQSAEQIRQIAPRTTVISAADMAFAAEMKLHAEQKETGILGVSVRKKILRNTEEIYPRYCEQVKNTIISYLDADDNHEVCFLAFSKGSFDDESVAADIIHMCPEEYQKRIQSFAFDGNVDSFIEEIRRCESLLCTRFHSIVLAILLRKPFVPIVYEEKTKRLLKEIGYTGISPVYEEVWKGDEVLKELRERLWDENKLTSYLDHAKRFFVPVDRILQKKVSAPWHSVLWKKTWILIYKVFYKISK